MKTLKIFLLICLFGTQMMAHPGGHHKRGKAGEWAMMNGEVLTGTLIKTSEHEAFIELKNGTVMAYEIRAFGMVEQLRIMKYHEHIRALNTLVSPSEPSPNYLLMTAVLLLGLGLGFGSKRLYFKLSTRYAVLALMLGTTLFIYACGQGSADDTVPDDNNPTGTLAANDPAAMAALFGQFAGVSTESDGTWFYVAGNGLPEHDMMVGITNWQQQVPIDQDFTGANRWQIPLNPTIASTPLPVENEFFRNAIGLAVNGIPIFHPMTNAGVDAFASGQLDQWGGHSGRADDYHYHLPPTHLQSTVGDGQPIAYALDGIPIFGYTTETLDENLGRYNEEGTYQYHTVSNYPYFIANLVGEVQYTETQEGGSTVYEIIPQPSTQGARPSTDPLGGTLQITDFTSTGENDYELTYTLDGETYRIHYGWDNSGNYTYEFIDPSGNATVEEYQRN